jgi:rhamnose utilization protein RhaD (predicted bifunctional aldolase and dehydrogenase)
MDEKLIQMSRTYGSNPAYVLAGGGNTSYKTEKRLFVKASGHALKTIDHDGFAELDRDKLKMMWETEYPKDTASREAAVLKDLMDARVPGETNRPSVETQLHDLLSFRYVLHLHPTLVNGLTCSLDGETWAKRNLGTDVLWIEATKPGYLLARRCKEAIANHHRTYGRAPKVLLLENHGVFFNADTTEEIDVLAHGLFEILERSIESEPDFTDTGVDTHNWVNWLKTVIPDPYVLFETNKAIAEIVQSEKDFSVVSKPFTPDHIVYCRSEFLYTDRLDVSCAYAAYRDMNGYTPRIILIEGIGLFVVGATETEVRNARDLFFDQLKIAHYAKNYGGPKPMTDDDIRFIKNWEVEHYRFKVLAT